MDNKGMNDAVEIGYNISLPTYEARPATRT